MAVYGVDQTTLTEKRDEPGTPPQEMMMQLSVPEHQSLCPLPRFAEVASSLWGEHSPQMVIGVPAGEEEESFKPVGSLSDMYIDILTCTVSSVDLGIDPMVEDHPVPALWEHSNSD